VSVIKISDYTTHHVPNNSMNNAYAALMGRVYYVNTDGDTPPQPKPRVFDRFNRFYRSVLSYFPTKVGPVSLTEFLKRYTGRRLTIYTNAVNNIIRRGLGAATPGIADIQLFVKAEKVGKSPDDAVGRIISPRSPEYNVLLGRHISHLEHRMYDAIDKTFMALRPDSVQAPTVAKGHNAEARANILWRKWSSFRDPIGFGADANRFDQHVSVDALKSTDDLYCAISSEPNKLRPLLQLRHNNSMTGRFKDGFIRCRKRGGRCSGDMDTAEGNIIIASGMNYSLVSRFPFRVEILDDGDDVYYIMERRHYAAFIAGFEQWFRDFGFTISVEEPVDVFERIEFCQSQPVWDGDKWIMVRKWPSSMFKDCVSLKPLDNPNVYAHWTRAIGEWGLSLAGGIPIYSYFYNELVRRGEHGKAGWDDITLESGFRMLAKGMHRKHSEPTPASRVSFYKAFGVTPSDQRLWEQSMPMRIPEYHETELTARHIADEPPLNTKPFLVVGSWSDLSTTCA